MKRLLTLVCLWIALLGLTGCIRYDVGINYASQTRGEIVQHIRLGEQLSAFDGGNARAWLSSLEQRAKQLGGRVRRLSPTELRVTIPFNNGKELEQKFNQFFSAPASSEDAVSEVTPTLPNISSRLSLQESNLLLVQRDRLVYDLDLRSLAVLTTEGAVLVSPGALLDLEFSLTTPWGATIAPDSLQPQTVWRNHLTWRMASGQVNHLDIIFWMPSPLGIGALIIAGFVALGMGLKAQLSRPMPG
ncbi:MAG: DUF3153 domain-containing protein [Kaiparowitsia implicata GSE-PSE-MK54-09C]|jgi:hypothetical protein|nr:DUF3153 domain-containing protein [Kaiparowitsia implicata GSE-PSE-MK54-09C]